MTFQYFCYRVEKGCTTEDVKTKADLKLTKRHTVSYKRDKENLKKSLKDSLGITVLQIYDVTLKNKRQNELLHLHDTRNT